MHSCEAATDYGAKSDDFQLKFNNACNMLKFIYAMRLLVLAHAQETVSEKCIYNK